MGGLANRWKVSDRVLANALALLVALPAAWLALRAAASGWVPVNVDEATVVLRSWEVGTESTPLVGSYSRFGWDHPGPLLFWVSMPGARLLGPPGVLLTAGLLNALACAGVVLAARRIGGLALAAPAALATAVMAYALTGSGLVDPWNPYVAVIPLLLYLVSVWGAADGDRVLLVVAVVTGSWCVQAHLGYLPVTVAAAGLACAWRLANRGVWWLQARGGADPAMALADDAGLLSLGAVPGGGPVEETAPDRGDRLGADRLGAEGDGGTGRDPAEGDARRRMAWPWVLGAAVVGLLLWLPPLIEQYREPKGNLRKLYEFARYGLNPAELASDPVGWDPAFDVAGGAFGIPGSWMSRRGKDTYLEPPSGSLLVAGLVLLVVAGLGVVAWRRGNRRAAGMAALAVLLVPVSVIAVARTADELLGYLLRWTWAVAALGWIAAGWVLVELLGPRARQALAAAVAVVVLVVGVLVFTDGTMDRFEDEPGRDVVADMGDQLLAELDRDTTYYVSVEETHWYYLVLPGIALDLILEGQPVVVHEGLRHMMKDRWTADPAVDYPRVTIMPRRFVAQWRQTHPDARRIAVYEPPDNAALASGIFAEPHEAWLVPLPVTPPG